MLWEYTPPSASFGTNSVFPFNPALNRQNENVVSSVYFLNKIRIKKSWVNECPFIFNSVRIFCCIEGTVAK